MTLSSVSQKETCVRIEVEALLGTGSLAGDFISEDIVIRYNLHPVMSDTSHTVCSAFNNCLQSNAILLLRVAFFYESSKKYDTYDIKALIFESTPVNRIVGRNTIEVYNFFEKIPSQLGGKLLIPEVDPILKCNKIQCDCLSEPPLTPISKTLTGSEPSSLLASLSVESQNL